MIDEQPTDCKRATGKSRPDGGCIACDDENECHESQTTPPRCGCSAVRPYRHSVYCVFYRPYGQALASVCFEPGDPGYEEASALKLRVGSPK